MVLGGGSFGTVLANMIACNDFPVTLWMRDSENAQLCEATGFNERYLPGYALSDQLIISDDLGDSVRDAEIVIFAVPSGSLTALVKEVVGSICSDIVTFSSSLYISKSINQNPFFSSLKID